MQAHGRPSSGTPPLNQRKSAYPRHSDPGRCAEKATTGSSAGMYYEVHESQSKVEISIHFLNEEIIVRLSSTPGATASRCAMYDF